MARQLTNAARFSRNWAARFFLTVSLSATLGTTTAVAADCTLAGPPIACSATLGGLTGKENGLTNSITAAHLLIANEKFRPACGQHDQCYRHGQKTYGLSREQCDRTFLADCKAICKDITALDIVAGLHTTLACLGIAEEYYAGVRKFAEASFMTSGKSTYCRWQEPEQLVHYRTALGPFLLRYQPNHGNVYIHPVSANGTLGDIVHKQNPGGGWDRLVSYTVRSSTATPGPIRRSGPVATAPGPTGTLRPGLPPPGTTPPATTLPPPGTSYLLFYDRNGGNARIHQVSADGGFGGILYQPSFGGNWDQIVPYTSESGTFIALYSRGNGHYVIYQVDETNGGIRQLGGPSQMGGNWDIIVPYTVGGKSYHLWYERGGGKMKVLPIVRSGGYALPVHQGVPGGGWHRIIPYAVGSSRFLLWHSDANGKANIYPLAANGGYGALVSSSTPGGGWDISSYVTTNGTYLLFAAQDMQVHPVGLDGRYQ